jgi:serine/threonine-protein kinase
MVELEGYELIEKIGAGGMATVWKARQLSLDRIVAIKLLEKSSLPDAEARELFRKEARTAARLNHPNIVQVFDTGEINGAAYLVMEFVDGNTVGDLILRQGALAEERALEIVEAVARALAYAWEKECLIHCDIKPDNILIDRLGGTVKVADLGLARMIGLRRDATQDDAIIGTPNYVAPEQSAGTPDLDCRVDMYALGATLYHMVTGVMPFRDSRGSQAMTRHENDFIEDPSVINPTLPASVSWLIEKLMIKNRALRSHFWTQVIKDIEAVRRGDMPHAPLPEEGASTVRRSPLREIKKGAPVRVPLKPASGAAQRITLKKSEMPRLTATPTARKKSRAGAFLRGLFSLALTMAALYGVLIYHGKMPMPPLPWAPPATPEEPAEQTGEIENVVEPEAAEPSPEVWRNEDFLQGARLFNQALAEYKKYQETRENPDILKDVEQNCRDAIAYFEAARADAPEHINLGQYIDQCNGMIFNVRQSTTMESPAAPAAAAPASPPEPPPVAPARRQIVFVDDEPAPPAAETAVPEKPRLSVSMPTDWDHPAAGHPAFAQEWQRLFSRHAAPGRESMVDASVVLYPGIACMTGARDAARVLQQELPIRRSLNTPGLPKASLFYYTFTKNPNGLDEIILVVDQNDRVVMVQIQSDGSFPPRIEEALFSTNWTVYDFLGARRRADTDGLIAHRVRKQDGRIRLDTELAEASATPKADRLVKTRIALMMPEQMAGMILYSGGAR